MIAFTPCNPKSLSAAQKAASETREVIWRNYEWESGVVTTQKVIHTVTHQEGGSQGFPVTFAAMKHPAGKAWSSLFISASASGEGGVSLTWWHRRPGLKGQINVKRESHGSWYKTVQSKLDGKYAMLSFVGNLSSASSVGLPGAPAYEFSWMPGLMVAMKPKFGHGDIGGIIGKTLINFEPISSFLGSLAKCDLNFCDPLLSQFFNGDPESDLIYEAINAMSLFANLSESAESAPGTRVVEDQECAEAYSSWGLFG